MPTKYDVVVETAQAELVAAFPATVPISGIARAWKPALDHPERRNEAMNVDFGVQVARRFEAQGDVRCIAQVSWEIYGDWTDDPALLETTIKYLLA